MGFSETTRPWLAESGPDPSLIQALNVGSVGRTQRPETGDPRDRGSQGGFSCWGGWTGRGPGLGGWLWVRGTITISAQVHGPVPPWPLMGPRARSPEPSEPPPAWEIRGVPHGPAPPESPPELGQAEVCTPSKNRRPWGPQRVPSLVLSSEPGVQPNILGDQQSVGAGHAGGGRAAGPRVRHRLQRPGALSLSALVGPQEGLGKGFWLETASTGAPSLRPLPQARHSGRAGRLHPGHPRGGPAWLSLPQDQGPPRQLVLSPSAASSQGASVVSRAPKA